MAIATFFCTATFYSQRKIATQFVTKCYCCPKTDVMGYELWFLLSAATV